MSGPDRLLAAVSTAAVFLGVAFGAASVAPGAEAERRFLALRAQAVSGALGAPAAPGAGGPSAPATERLPAGVRIDPTTLELVGLDIAPGDGSTLLAWSSLRSYEYEKGLRGLPAALRALDGTSVTMVGFLLPLYEFDDIRQFHLVASHWSCCFGVPPGINGWVEIALAPGEAGLRNTTEPLRVTGTFRVREKEEAGWVTSIYAIESARARVLSW